MNVNCDCCNFDFLIGKSFECICGWWCWIIVVNDDYVFYGSVYFGEVFECYVYGGLKVGYIFWGYVWDSI